MTGWVLKLVPCYLVTSGRFIQREGSLKNATEKRAHEGCRNEKGKQGLGRRLTKYANTADLGGETCVVAPLLHMHMQTCSLFDILCSLAIFLLMMGLLVNLEACDWSLGPAVISG